MRVFFLGMEELEWIDPLDLEQDYKFIRYEEPERISGFLLGYGTDPCFEYTYFMKLMKKLEELYVQTGCGFWCNRHLILRQIQNLTIVVDQKTKEIVAFYVIRRRKKDDNYVIDFIQVFTPGQGLGKILIQCEFFRPGLCVEEALRDSVGFWEKMGIPCEKVLNH